MSGISGQVVVITGASRGLGRALALSFAEAGARLALCSRSRESLAALLDELEARKAVYSASTVDVGDSAAVAVWSDQILTQLGTPAVLINNASILGPREPLLAIGPGEWREVIEANLNGTFNLTHAIAPLMVASGSGSIINVSSGASLPPRVNWGAYAVSKTALDAFSYNLAAELGDTGVRVNIVDPGAMRTEMRAGAYPTEDPLTLKRPEAIAPLFHWLAGDRSRGVTGQRFQADEWLRQNPQEGLAGGA